MRGRLRRRLWACGCRCGRTRCAVDHGGLHGGMHGQQRRGLVPFHIWGVLPLMPPPPTTAAAAATLPHITHPLFHTHTPHPHPLAGGQRPLLPAAPGKLRGRVGGGRGPRAAPGGALPQAHPLPRALWGLLRLCRVCAGRSQRPAAQVGGLFCVLFWYFLLVWFGGGTYSEFAELALDAASGLQSKWVCS